MEKQRKVNKYDNIILLFVMICMVSSFMIFNFLIFNYNYFENTILYIVPYVIIFILSTKIITG
jgi:hypothetical protein